MGRCSLSPPDERVAHLLALNCEKLARRSFPGCVFKLRSSESEPRSSKCVEALSNGGRQLKTVIVLKYCALNLEVLSTLIEKYKTGNSGQREGPGRTRRSRPDSERTETGSSIGWHDANSDTECAPTSALLTWPALALCKALFNLSREI